MMEFINRFRPTITELSFALLLAKTLTSTISGWDCLGVLVVVGFVNIGKITDYLFPKRVDLFKEVIELQLTLAELQQKFEEQEHDITALKFAGNVGRK